ncbi:MAG TPA: replication protein RepA [Acetobacteraceae bacterium]|nr:replication protein RepA [Acetobacteraceae bacterium]
MHPDLFTADTTVHDLIEAKGRKGAKDLVVFAAREPGRNAPIDILAGRRGPRIIEAAATHMSDETSPEKAVRSHVYSAWCHAGMPHKKPREDTANWRIETDYVTLLIEPGTRVEADGQEAPIGLPFGSYARLILIDWQTEALERDSRDVLIGPSLKASLKRMGLPHGGKVMELVREQVERLAGCRFTFHLKTSGGRGAVANVNIVDHIEYCEARAGGSTRRYVERVRLSELFYQQLRAHPVSVDRASVIAIRNSSMALDLYMWLAYRLRSLDGEKHVSWTALKGQFGGGVSAMRNFKPLFSENLQLALGVYRTANVVLTPTGVLLRPSPPPVPQRTPLLATG